LTDVNKRECAVLESQHHRQVYRVQHEA